MNILTYMSELPANKYNDLGTVLSPPLKRKLVGVVVTSKNLVGGTLLMVETQICPSPVLITICEKPLPSTGQSTLAIVRALTHRYIKEFDIILPPISSGCRTGIFCLVPRNARNCCKFRFHKNFPQFHRNNCTNQLPEHR